MSHPALNLIELLHQQATDRGPQTLYTFLKDGETESATLTYQALHQQALAIGAYLRTVGEVGDRVLLLYPPGLEFISGFWGCVYGGMMPVPAYPPRPNQKLTRLQAIATNSQAKVALTTSGLLADIQTRWTADPNLPPLQWLATDELLEGGETYPDLEIPEITGRSPAFLQYTSGSTGTPKGVVISHQNLLHNLEAIKRGFGHSAQLRGVIWLPPYHDMGLIGGILQAIYVGGSVVLMPPTTFLQKPSRWLQAISKYRATTSGGPNFAYDLCTRKVKPELLETLDLSSWEVAFNGAEPIRAETLDKFAETFAPCGFKRQAFYPCYGMAEATLLVTGIQKNQVPLVHQLGPKPDPLQGWTQGHEAPLNQGNVALLNSSRGVVGCGAPWGEETVMIVDPETLTPCDDGQEGEIWVAGDSVAQGYWQRQQETEATFAAYLASNGEGPFLRTGDLGFFLDASGDTNGNTNGNGPHRELFVTGRLKDVMIVHGQNYYPQDVELTVEKSHGGIRPYGSAAFMVKQQGQERLVVALEVERLFIRKLDTEGQSLVRQVRKAVLEEHGLQLYRVVLLKPGRLPKTSSGKVQRYACRDQYLQGELVSLFQEEGTQGRLPLGGSSLDPGSDSWGETFNQGVIETWTKQWLGVELGLDSDTIDLGGSFADYGLDSVKAAEFVQDLETWSWYSLDLSTLINFPTIQDLCGHLAENLNGRPIPVAKGTRPQRDLEESVNGDRPMFRSYDEIPDEYYRLEAAPEYQQLQQRLAQTEAFGRGNPYLNVNDPVAPGVTKVAGKELINFSSYDYLGLARHPEIALASKNAIDRYGTSVSASRLAAGERSLHRDLEQGLASLLQVEDCIVYVSGHATNVTTIGHLFGSQDLILYDSLSHNSIVQGCILSGATAISFPHNDWQTLEYLLKKQRPQYRRVLIAIEGLYSMEGDLPDLPKFIDLKKRYKTLLLVDEAHSIGVLGAEGRGIGQYFEIDRQDVDLWMGTLSKAFASCGGYIAGSRAIVEYLKYTAPGFVYSVGLSPSNTAAASESLRVLAREPQRVSQLAARSQQFLQGANERGWNTGTSHDSPIVPIIVGDSKKCIQMSYCLFDKGVNVQPMIYPAVPDQAARLRFFISCAHTPEQIDRTLGAIAEAFATLEEPCVDN